MAKNNINLGTLSGKLGDNVFWRTHGQQRVRTYFKREVTQVGYEAAERQSRFANLKSIYQWLPDDFKKACNLYKVGGNSYADFMRQYNDYGMGRDKQGFGVGRFLPVECSVSNGTLNVPVQSRFAMCDAFIETSVTPVIPALVIPVEDSVGGLSEWGEMSYALLRTYKTLRPGDYLHILLAYVYYDTTHWGDADAVAGFPFPYSGTLHWRLKIDEDSDINFTQGNQYHIWQCGGNVDESDDKFYGGYGFAADILPVAAYLNVSVCGALMFERPTNTRQQRYSPSKLRFNRSQLEILSSRSQGSWNDYCSSSFMRGQ